MNILISNISFDEAKSWTPSCGVSTFGMELSEFLSNKFEVYVLVRNNQKNKDLIVPPNERINLITIDHSKEVFRIIKDYDIDLIHSINTDFRFLKLKTPIIQNAWYYPHNFKERIINEVLRCKKKYPLLSEIGAFQYNLIAYLTDELAYRNATQIFAPTMVLKDQLNAKIKCNVNYIPCPINTEIFRPNRSDEKDFLSILYIGKTSIPQKGFKYLLDALKILKNKHYNIIFRLVGAADSNTLHELSNLCTVDYKGIIERQKLPAIFSESDIFVFPSLYEEYGYVVLEAMACGLPIISTDIFALKEILGNAGIIVPSKNSGALSSALIRLIEDKNLREQLGIKARNRAVDVFSWNTIGKKIIDIDYAYVKK